VPTNATSYGPYDSGAGANITEGFWRTMARWFAPNAVVGGYLNELNPFGDSTGLQAKVNTGGALIRGAYGEWTSTTTLGLAAVGGIAGGSERYDRLVVRNDFVNNVMQLDVLTGTAGASPTALRPALTQTTSMWEYLLADVGPLNNATTTVTAAMVLDGRWKISETGILYYEVAPASTSTVIPAAGAIPSTAKILQIEWQARSSSGNTSDFLNMLMNADAGAHYTFSDGALGNTTYAGTGQAAAQSVARAGIVPGTGTNPAAGTIKVYYPSTSATFKGYSSETVRGDTTSAAFVEKMGGGWSSSAVITALTLQLAAGNFTGASVIALALP
jgi:hypothetical protein